MSNKDLMSNHSSSTSSSSSNGKYWDVLSVPPSTTMKGKLLRVKRRERIGIEGLFVLVFKPCKKKVHVDDDDDSVSSCWSTQTVYSDNICEHKERKIKMTGWMLKHKFPLRMVRVSIDGKQCIITSDQKTGIKSRTMIFTSKEDARSFFEMFLQKKEESERYLKSSMEMIGRVQSGEIILLIEIVSGYDLPPADIGNNSDPYVVVRMGNKEIHRTKFIPKTLNPIWTVRTDSLFLLRVSPDKFFKCHEGIVFEVNDFDALAKHDSLGAVYVPTDTLYNAEGERLEFSLKPLPGQKDLGTGTLVIRCRHATPNDISFMEKLAEGHLKSETRAPTSLFSSSTMGVKRMVTKSSHTDADGIRRYRVKPGPDPTLPASSTKWLTETQIHSLSLRKSREWLDLGSGELGRVYLEIIGCDNLPNMDIGGSLGNKTDAFVSVVYEDSVSKTDVIYDCLSPRWLPWTRRAFVFRTRHTSSTIFLGVFDQDDIKLVKHEFIGRVAVDFTTLTPCTEFVLRYNLYNSTSYTTRDPRGQIIIRLSFEYCDERRALLSNLAAPFSAHVHVPTSNEFHSIRSGIFGKKDMTQYNTENIYLYLEEIVSYRDVFFHCSELLINILLWRKVVHIPIYIPTLSTKKDPWPFTKRIILPLPIHSMAAFITGIVLLENPSLLPSFIFVLIAWIMFVGSEFRHKDPSPWNCTKSFYEMLCLLMFGTSPTPPLTIRANQNLEKVEEYNASAKSKLLSIEAEARKNYENAAQKIQNKKKDFESVQITQEEKEIHTKVDRFSVDPLKPVLFPVQKGLDAVCKALRCTRNVVLWQECYYSFWISFWSIALAIACSFVPWTRIVLWSSRITVWTLLGPWMKLVDLFIIHKEQTLSEEEFKEQQHKEMKKWETVLKDARSRARLAGENIAKTQAMKNYLFGGFVAKVPVLKQDRFIDQPLPDSTATPLRKEEPVIQQGKIIRVPGQHVVGDMIPVLEEVSILERVTAQTGVVSTDIQPQQQQSTSLLENNSDSDTYSTKLKILLVFVTIFSWFAIPFIISVLHLFFTCIFVRPVNLILGFLI